MMRREDYQNICQQIELAIEEADHGKDNRPTLQLVLRDLEIQQTRKRV